MMNRDLKRAIISFVASLIIAALILLFFGGCVGPVKDVWKYFERKDEQLKEQREQQEHNRRSNVWLWGWLQVIAPYIAATGGIAGLTGKLFHDKGKRNALLHYMKELNIGRKES